MGVDSQDIPAEYYSLGAKLKFYFEPVETVEFKIETEWQTDKVSLDEIWGQWSFSSYNLKFGMYENDLLPYDGMNNAEFPFAADSLLSNRLKTSGWYSKRGLGTNFYTKKSKEGVGGNFSTFFTSSLSTLQFTGDLFYPAGNNQFGVVVSYIPVMYKQSDETYYTMSTLYIRNLEEKSLWFYSTGLSFGKNIGDPGGYTQYPEGYKSNSSFFAFDGFISRNMGIWNPALGATYVIHDIDIPESCSFEGKVGNKFTFEQMFYIHTDLGIRTNIYYDPDLTTGLEMLWALKLQFRY